jgi:acetolactate synthase-1/2/3 large subunit
MTVMSGAEIVAEYLAKEEVPFAVGLPGHSVMSVVHAIGSRGIKVMMARTEQGACHIADGYFKACGKPAVVFTTSGAGATNAALGTATAFIDSSAFVLITGDVPRKFAGNGNLQGLERGYLSDVNSVLRPLVKASWYVSTPEMLPATLHRAFKMATSGRPGPVHITIPSDVAAATADVIIPDPGKHKPRGRVRADPDELGKAAKLLVKAKRPVILAGGGVTMSGASRELRALAEHLGIPVVTSELGMGKGAIPEDHPLCAFYPGSPGSPSGNEITKKADLILAVGCRFTDFTSSSWIPGITFSIPPTKLVQIDIDPTEIAKDYPVEVGVVGDAKASLNDLLEIVKGLTKPRNYRNTPYFKELTELKKKFASDVSGLRNSKEVTQARFVTELRKALGRDAIIVSSTSYSAPVISQLFPVYGPRRHIASSGFSTMGYALPAAIGVKLARPDAQVVAVDGDGSFMFTASELATAMQNGIHLMLAIHNNKGFISVKDSMVHAFGSAFAVDPLTPDGKLYSPDFKKLAESYGCYSERITDVSDIQPALKRALSSKKTAVLEVMVEREFPKTGTKFWGHWEVPAYQPKKR